VSKFPGFPTKVVVLSGLRLEIPSHWICGPMEDGRWWSGTEDGTTRLYSLVESLDVPSGATESEPRTNTEVYVARTVDFLKTLSRAGEIEIDRIQSGYVVHAVTNDEEGGKPWRFYRWYSIMGRTDYVNCARLALIVSPDTAGDPATVWLFNHFRARAYSLDMFARTPGRADPLALKDLSVDDLFGIRIPDDWAHDISVFTEIRSVWCYPRDPKLGKLLIAYDYAPLKPEYCDGRDPDITNKLADLRDLAFVEDDERRRLSRARYKAPLGVIVYAVDDEKPRPYTEEDIDRYYVRYHQWFYVIAGRRHSLVAFFNLKIPLRWIGRPEAAETLALMECEIRTMRLLQAFDR